MRTKTDWKTRLAEANDLAANGLSERHADAAAAGRGTLSKLTLFFGAAAGVAFLFSFTLRSEIAGLVGVALGALAALFVAASRHLYVSTPVTRTHLAGATVVPASPPAKTSGNELPPIPIGGTQFPSVHTERMHTIIEGSPGSGKTQLLKQMVHAIRERGDTVVIVDNNGDMLNTFGQAGDLVLNPFDPRSVGWLPQNEIRTPADWATLATSIIGEGTGNSKEWFAMARAMFAAVGRGYQKICETSGKSFDNAIFYDLLTAAGVDDLTPFLATSSAAALLDNEKGLANVRMTFFDRLAFWEYLTPGDFSVKNWVASGDENSPRKSIFITYKTSEIATLKTLISTVIDQLAIAALDAGENQSQRVWIIIDELSGLGEIPALKLATTQLRRTGFRVVVGLQNYDQIEELYGNNGAKTITGSLSNKIIFRSTDPASAERQSQLIGDARSRVSTRSQSGSTDSGTNGGWNVSTQDVVERVVLASEIAGLPDLTCYVKFSGSSETILTSVPIYGLD